MVTLTFAGDEAGDVSFAFDKGASRYFVVAVIATPDPDGLYQVLTDLRRDSGLRSNYEFNFHALSSSRLRKRVLAALGEADFEAWALIADKLMLSDSFKVMSRLDFYIYFVTELIRLIPPEKRDGATLILDEFGPAERLRTELRRFMIARDIPRRFKRVLVKRSRSEPLIQVADLVAGSILRRDTRADADAFDYLAKKVKQILEYRGG
ncbi:MAG: DUF3800 domain-containing protein [Chloroflexi bacterium]|nr:DUF3800 domain-containing protein [Chloroflexota bacterium]